MRRTALFSIFAALLTAGTAIAAPLPQPREASIPFANHGGIYNWQTVDRDTLYVQDNHRRWYRAELMGNCFDLDFAQAIGFRTNPSGNFDRFSDVIVRGERCPLKSFVASDPPPKRAKKRHG